jgi:hypothetical protein
MTKIKNAERFGKMTTRCKKQEEGMKYIEIEKRVREKNYYLKSKC